MPHSLSPSPARLVPYAGEVSAANYAARQFGVHSGMWMGEAKRRCPALIVLPYDFEAYSKVAEQVGRGDRSATQALP